MSRARKTGTAGSARIGRAAFTEDADLYRLLVESVGDYAIFALDTNGCILTWNKGAQRLKGYTTAEIVGQHFSVFYPPRKSPQGSQRGSSRVRSRSADSRMRGGASGRTVPTSGRMSSSPHCGTPTACSSASQR